MTEKKYNVAVVGATGVVGEVILEILAQRKFPVGALYPVASENSAGSQSSSFSTYQTLIFQPEEMMANQLLAGLQLAC